MSTEQFRPVGWEPMQAEWWPAIAATIVRPWPREAVLFDLRWWRGQERATGRKLMPGRPALQERWGLGEWDARKLLRAEAEWCDPKHRKPEESGKLSSDSPAALQPDSSGPPARTTENAANMKESSSNPPAALQPLSSDSPSRAILLSTDTPSTAHRAHTDMSAASPAPEPSAPPAPKPEPKPDALTPGELAVWQAYRLHHPTAKATPPKAHQGLLRAAVAEHGAEAVVSVVRWAHQSEHERARYLRDGGYTGLDNLLRREKLPARIELAAKEEAGEVPRPKLSALPPGMKPRGPVVIDAESGRVEEDSQPRPSTGSKRLDLLVSAAERLRRQREIEEEEERQQQEVQNAEV